MARTGWFETVAEAQRRAAKRLPPSVYSALVAGSEKGITVGDNLSMRSVNWVSRRTWPGCPASVTSRQP